MKINNGFLLLTGIDREGPCYVKASSVVAIAKYKTGSMVWFDSPGITQLFIVAEPPDDIMEAVWQAQLRH